MRDAARADRQKQIEVAAYELLEERGYAGTSMLSIAKRAKASNETLYRWYGDKQGLFKTLVERNAAEVRKLLETDPAGERSPLEVLRVLGQTLLNVLVGSRAIALNRAAAADASGELGHAIATTGRESVMPLIVNVFRAARNAGMFTGTSAKDAAELYLNLLVGDLQIRRAIGALDMLKKAEINRRADRALVFLQKALAS